jgi:hypothetical protein
MSKHPLQNDVDLCIAVGIDVARFDLMDIFMLAGSIQREVGGGSLAKVRAMNDAQRTALRDSAFGVLPIKRGKS